MYKRLLICFLLAATLADAQDIDVQHYRFTLGLTDESNEITGSAGITIRFLKPVAAFSLDLVAQGPDKKGMKAIVSGENVMGQVNNKTSLTVRLKRPAVVDSVYAFNIQYRGTPADGLIISKNKYGDRTFFSDNWPNRAHHWIPCVDRPDDKASFEFIVMAPAHYRVVSNGIKVEEKKAGNGFTLTHWKEDTPLPTKVMAIGIARFATKTFADSPAGLPISAWVYPQDSTKGFYDYAMTPEIVTFFAAFIAPFPYKKLANVQSKTIFGGMENASAIFYAENSVTGDRSKEDLLTHEIAHQWFGDMATEKSFAHLWLSEGFANYFTNYYFEKKYGKQAAVKCWQEEREEVIEFAKGASSPVVDSTANLMSLLNANSYQKGAWVLYMLRAEVGDETFQKIIQTYYHQYRGANAETRDFEAIAEAVAGKELTWFFDQWLYRQGNPVLQVTSNVENNQLKLYIKQQGQAYRLNLEVDIRANDGGVTRKRVEIKEKESTFLVPVNGPVTITVDPDTKLLFTLLN